MIAIVNRMILVVLVTWLSTGDAIRRNRLLGKPGPPENANPVQTKMNGKMTKKKGSKSVFFPEEVHRFLDEGCSLKTKPPTEIPRNSPSQIPSDMPSKIPSANPSDFPSESPFLPPPEMLNESCPVLTMECALANGKSCDIPQPVKEECEERPSKMTMIFRGGDCSQSNHSQEDDKFNCQDYQGGPPTKNGDHAYIVVTDVKGKGIVYHSDWVFVGDKFFLQNGNDDFEADQFIKIYSSSDTTENNLLQLVKYHSSCSQNLFLMDTFGASQLVEWYSNEQGLVSSFIQMNYQFNVVIPVTVGGSSHFTFQEFIIETNLPEANIPPIPFYSQELLFDGQEFNSGSNIRISIPAKVDLSVSKQYKISIRYVLKTESGGLCEGVALSTVTVI